MAAFTTIVAAVGAATAAAGAYQTFKAGQDQKENFDRQNSLVKAQDPIFSKFNKAQTKAADLTNQRDKRLAAINRRLNTLNYQQQVVDYRRAQRQNIRDTMVAGDANALALTGSGAGLGSSAFGGAAAALTVESTRNSGELRSNFQRAQTARQANVRGERTQLQFNALISRANRRAAAAQTLLNQSNRSIQQANTDIQRTSVSQNQGQALFNAGVQTIGGAETAGNVFTSTFGKIG